MNGNGAGTHLGDDELLRLIDGDEDPRRPLWEAHIATCAHCAGEVDSLRTDALAVHAWLRRAAFEEGVAEDGVPGLLAGAADEDAHDAGRAVIALDRTPPVRAARRSRTMTPWLRAAAIIALLATPAAAIPALRQWVADAVSGAGEETGTTLVAPRAAAETDLIRFVPAHGAFVVEVEQLQRAGELRLERAAGAEAVLQADDEHGALPVVSAAVLRIRNRAEDATGYTLQLPASVSSVTVRMAGRSTVVERGQLDSGAVVPLH
jgi:hypothetical protein